MKQTSQNFQLDNRPVQYSIIMVKCYTFSIIIYNNQVWFNEIHLIFKSCYIFSTRVKMWIHTRRRYKVGLQFKDTIIIMIARMTDTCSLEPTSCSHAKHRNNVRTNYCKDKNIRTQSIFGPSKGRTWNE